MPAFVPIIHHGDGLTPYTNPTTPTAILYYDTSHPRAVACHPQARSYFPQGPNYYAPGLPRLAYRPRPAENFHPHAPVNGGGTMPDSRESTAPAAPPPIRAPPRATPTRPHSSSSPEKNVARDRASKRPRLTTPLPPPLSYASAPRSVPIPRLVSPYESQRAPPPLTTTTMRYHGPPSSPEGFAAVANEGIEVAAVAGAAVNSHSVPAAADDDEPGAERFECMKLVKWKVRKILPPDDELERQALEFATDLSRCDVCWSIQGKRTSCTCVQGLRGRRDLILYLARVKRVVEEMRVNRNDTYERYVRLLMSEHACDVRRGVHPLPRLPSEGDCAGLSMDSILPDLANRRICKGLWRKIIGVTKQKYEEFERFVRCFRDGEARDERVGKGGEVDINDLLHCYNRSGEMGKEHSGLPDPTRDEDDGTQVSIRSQFTVCGSQISSLSHFSFTKYV